MMLPVVLVIVALVVIIFLIRKRNTRDYSVSKVFKVIQTANKQSDDTARNILVIGGSGFLGATVIRKLLDDGGVNGQKYNVFSMDAVPPRGDRFRSDVTYCVGDIRNPEALSAAINLPTNGKTIESVLQIAAILPAVGVPEAFMRSVNVEGTKQVIAACEQHDVSRLVYTSSATVLLDNKNSPLENVTEDHPIPQHHPDLYTTTKAEAEDVLQAAMKRLQGKLNIGIARPSGIFGADDNLLAQPRLERRENILIGQGHASLDLVHVNSVALGHILIEQNLGQNGNAVGQIYHLSNNLPIKYRDFFGKDTNADGLTVWGSPPVTSIPVPVVVALATFNELTANLLNKPLLTPSLSVTAVQFTQRSYSFNNTKAKRDLGYECFLKGDVDATIKWMVDGYNDSKKKK